MTKANRYHFLRYTVPRHLLHYIKAFPTDYIGWVQNEQMLSQHFINSYMRHPNERADILKTFEETCKMGSYRKKVISRKCTNQFCEEQVMGRMVVKDYEVRLCNNCITKAGPRIKLLRDLR